VALRGDVVVQKLSFTVWIGQLLLFFCGVSC